MSRKSYFNKFGATHHALPPKEARQCIPLPGVNKADPSGVGFLLEAVGEGVTGWSVGDRAVDIHMSCGKCYYCQRGISTLCMGGRVRGHPYDGTPSPIPNAHRLGAMAEYVVRKSDSKIKVPESGPDREAAMCEPLATGVTSCWQQGLSSGIQWLLSV